MQDLILSFTTDGAGTLANARITASTDRQAGPGPSIDLIFCICSVALLARRQAHRQRAAAFRVLGATPERSALAIPCGHAVPAGRAGRCRPVACGGESQQALARFRRQAFEHREEERAVEQGDGVYCGEGAGVCGETVGGHEEGLVGVSWAMTPRSSRTGLMPTCCAQALH